MSLHITCICLSWTESEHKFLTYKLQTNAKLVIVCVMFVGEREGLCARLNLLTNLLHIFNSTKYYFVVYSISVHLHVQLL